MVALLLSLLKAAAPKAVELLLLAVVGYTARQVSRSDRSRQIAAAARQAFNVAEALGFIDKLTGTLKEQSFVAHMTKVLAAWGIKPRELEIQAARAWARGEALARKAPANGVRSPPEK